MAERPSDPKTGWSYETTFPGSDISQNKLAVRMPKLVKSVGTDGRFKGAIRPFPGFGDETVGGVPKPSGSTTVTSLSNIIFAKYVTIQKGRTGDDIRGIFYIADGTSGKAAYFAYQDSTSATKDVIKLEEYDDWDDVAMGVPTDYDATSIDRYIYSSVVGPITAKWLATRFWPNKKAPYNKAYFWDFRINSWDQLVTGFDQRFMGVLPNRVMSYLFNDDEPTALRNSSDVLQESTQAISITDPIPAGISSYAIELVSHKHGLRSPLRIADSTLITDGIAHDSSRLKIYGLNNYKRNTDTTYQFGSMLSVVSPTYKWTASAFGTGEYYLELAGGGDPSVTVSNLPRRCMENGTTFMAVGTVGSLAASQYAYADNDTLGYTTLYVRLADDTDPDSKAPGYVRVNFEAISGELDDRNCLTAWGIAHADGFNIYKTIATSQGGDAKKYEAVNTLHLIHPYFEKTQPFPGITSGQANLVYGPVNDFWLSDPAVAASQAYDAFIDDVGAAPRMKRIAAYDGLLVGVTSIEEPTDFDEGWEETDQRQETLVWSSLSRDERENFPAGNFYIPDDASEKFLALEPAGDHLFAVGNQGIYKLTRSEARLSVNRLQSKTGGVSRWGQTGVGNSLFVVTEAGVKEVDGNTGVVRSIPELNRVIFNDAEWAKTLASVHVEYDGVAGVLIFLNTSKNECILLWESTGAITRLVDCPWDFLVGGPDATGSGGYRAYFVTNTGVVQCIDSLREQGKVTMYGGASGDTVNGTLTSAHNAGTQMTDSGASFSANCVGFTFYHQAASTGIWTSAVISSRDSATQLTLATAVGSAAGVASGDRYAVAPVRVSLSLPSLMGSRGPDPFVKKVTTTMRASLSNLSGETTTSDKNAKVQFGVDNDTNEIRFVEAPLDSSPDQCLGLMNTQGIRLYPTLNFYGANQDWELQAVLVKGQLSASERETRSG